MNEPFVRPWARRPDVRVGAVVAVAIAVAFVAWLLVRGGDSNPNKPTGQAVGPVETTAAKLRALSVELGHPIYWAGALPDRKYELTRTSDDRIFVRYLPRDVQIGIRQAAFTIIGTYPVDNAYKVLQRLGKKPREHNFAAPVGGFAVYSSDQPSNVYLAYPGSNLQIEVYDPSPKQARDLITSGQVEPVR
jgi:hypothetical protein